jgi:imidazoleglycerol phosphate synthase glutamine amidotransferase subunit HisH
MCASRPGTNINLAATCMGLSLFCRKGNEAGVETAMGCNNGIVARIRMVPVTVPSDWSDGRSVL